MAVPGLVFNQNGGTDYGALPMQGEWEPPRCTGSVKRLARLSRHEGVTQCALADLSNWQAAVGFAG
jgi:hypothetical protein